jgi:hypothetical protein
MKSGASPFKINIAQGILDDLESRLKNTRRPNKIVNSGWDYGTNLSYLKELICYWENEFDWRKQEEQINRVPQFMTGSVSNPGLFEPNLPLLAVVRGLVERERLNIKIEF